MAAKGEIELVFSSEPDINPYSIPGAVTEYGDGFSILSGVLTGNNSDSGFYQDAAPAESVVRSQIEAGNLGSSRHGPAVVTPSGEGMMVSIGPTVAILHKIEAGAKAAQYGSSVQGLSVSVGSLISITYDKNTGAVAVTVDGVTVLERTYTALQGQDIRPAYHIDRSGRPLGTGIFSWAGGLNAELTVSGPLSPGLQFTATGVRFSSVPSGPVLITDTELNSISVPVTVTDNGGGDITATGTMPTLAEAVTAGSTLKFGDVDVELTA